LPEIVLTAICTVFAHTPAPALLAASACAVLSTIVLAAISAPPRA
jgi:hypothetical protein